VDARQRKGEQDAVGARTDRHLFVGETPLEVHVAEQAFVVVGASRKRDPGELADSAVRAVATEHVVEPGALLATVVMSQHRRRRLLPFFQPCQLDAALDRDTGALDQPAENALGRLLRKAHEATVHAVDPLRTNHDPAAAASRREDVGRVHHECLVEHLPHDPEVVEQLEGAGLDHDRARAVVGRNHRLVDHARHEPIARQHGRHRQTGRPGADHENVFHERLLQESR
jgi:hypothetical protein